MADNTFDYNWYLVESHNCNDQLRGLNMIYDNILYYQKEVYEFRKTHDILDITPIKLVDKVSDKIPIWVYWHQGFDNAPDVIKMCINSLKENMPLDKVEIILLDKNNLYKYIQTPTEILNNIKSNYTAYSDIIRFYLLYAYGGMYIDSTYLLVDKFPAENFEKDFWSVKTIYPSNRGYSPIIMFTTNLMYAKPGNPIMLFMYRYMSSYWYYSDISKRVYDIIMGVCYYGYTYHEYPRYYIEELNNSNTQVHFFCNVYHLLDKFTEYKYKLITDNTYFFKLSRKFNLYEYSEDQLTFWGYFKQKYLKGAFEL